MTSPRRVVLVGALLLAGANVTGATDPMAPTTHTVVASAPAIPTTVPATTTTVAPPPPTTAVTALQRASRAIVRPRPVVAHTHAVAAPDVREHAGSLPPIMLRIRYCESRNNYTAQNRSSTASGAWQFLDSSWAKYAGYPRAYMAPPEVQDQKALNVYNAVGTRPWRASQRCWG